MISTCQRGFSMVEVLISCIILGVGLLGLASLQTLALRHNHNSQLRALAVTQLNSMADRMRANAAGVERGSYNSLTSANPTMPSCTTCDPTEVAQRDFAQWIDNNRTLLPSGRGQITRNGQMFTITVMWDNDKTGATGTGCSGNPNVDLTCIQVNLEL